MKVPEITYFLYAIPSVTAFILGLNLYTNLENEEVNREDISYLVKKAKYLPYFLILFGFIFSYLSDHLSQNLRFLFFLLSNLRWAGVFMLVFTKRRLALLIVMLIYLIKLKISIDESLFHEFFLWTIILGCFFCLKYKPLISHKLLIGATFFILVLFIQSEKYAYRNYINTYKTSTGFTTFITLSMKNIENHGFFNYNHLAPTISRINQGFIISYLLNNIPKSIAFEHGKELKNILISAFIPRIIFPNKINSGNMESFKKYTAGLKYPGENTTMSLSAFGDAYINFGVVGGSAFMFLLGYFYNFAIQFLAISYKKKFIVFFLMPCIFFHALFVDSALETVLGSIVKNLILVCVFMLLSKLKIWYTAGNIKYCFSNQLKKH